MALATKVKTPRLWRVRDPIELVLLGQLELPGFDIAWDRIDDLASRGKALATSHKRRGHARLDIWPAARLTYQVDRDCRFEHEDEEQNG